MINEFTARLFSSLRRNGLRGTMRSGGRHLTTYLSTLVDRRFDHRYRVETGNFVEINEMTDVTSPNLERGIRYEPTRARPLRRILRQIDLPDDGVFVDIGCGKGRAMILAVERGFRRVVGVDFSLSLCEIARQNLEAFRRRSGDDYDWHVHHGDAVDFPIEADYSVFFFYNPFDAEVLRRVIERIDASLADHPRDVQIIYHNPLWRNTIELHDFKPVLERSYGGCDFVVYTRGANAPRSRSVAASPQESESHRPV